MPIKMIIPLELLLGCHPPAQSVSYTTLLSFSWSCTWLHVELQRCGNIFFLPREQNSLTSSQDVTSSQEVHLEKENFVELCSFVVNPSTHAILCMCPSVVWPLNIIYLNLAITCINLIQHEDVHLGQNMDYRSYPYCMF